MDSRKLTIIPVHRIIAQSKCNSLPIMPTRQRLARKSQRNAWKADRKVAEVKRRKAKAIRAKKAGVAKAK